MTNGDQVTKPIATLTLALALIAASPARPAATVQQPISETEAIELNDTLVPEIRRLNRKSRRAFQVFAAARVAGRSGGGRPREGGVRHRERSWRSSPPFINKC